VRVAGVGQRAPVEFAVVRERQTVEHDEGRGDHVLGQTLFEVCAKLARGRGRRARGAIRHHVSDEALAARGVGGGADGRLRDRGVLRERRLDLARLDAEAAYLDLLVLAPQILYLAVGEVTRHVARAVETFAAAAEGVGDELLGRRRRPVQVSAREALAADVEFAADSGGDGVQKLVEDVDASVVDGPADGRQRRPRLRLTPERVGRDDVALRGAVVVVERTAFEPLEEPDGGGRQFKLLARGRYLPQARERARGLAHLRAHLLEDDDGQYDLLDAVAVDEVAERGHVHALELRDEVERPAGGPRREHLVEARVEAERGEL
jgi:hypothetical protein